MKSIITGGAGFIGSHLSEKLLKLGHKVIIIDNFSTGKKNNLISVLDKVVIIQKDIRDFKSINKYFKGVDNVFHLAALADIVPSIENPDDYFSTNVIGTYNVLRASISNKVKRFIYSASSSCYGIPKKFPTPEETQISPQYPYALTKSMGEELVMNFSKIYNLNSTSLRFFNVYGPRARTTGTYGAVFGVFLAQKLFKKPYTVVGDGKQTRDFTYISDVIEAIISVYSNKLLKNKILNVGSGKTVSINKIVALLKGKSVKIPKRPGEPKTTYADIKKITTLTNWQPKVSIDRGIQFMLNHINEWKTAPVWTPNKIKQATKKWFLYLKDKK
jgi:UDP-glucose 4-epimerase